MHMLQHLIGGVRSGHGQHLGVDLAHQVLAVVGAARAKAAGHHDLAVLVQGLADGVQAFLHRGVDEAAGVDDDQVGTVVALGGFVAFGTQLGEDALGIDQRLGAAKRNETDLGRRGGGRGARGGGDDGYFSHGRYCRRAPRTAP
jgi:hypothetical protein